MGALGELQIQWGRTGLTHLISGVGSIESELTYRLSLSILRFWGIMKTWTNKIVFTLLGVTIALVLGCSDSQADTGDIRDLILYAERFDPCTPDDIRGRWGSCKNLYNTPDNIEALLKKHEMTYAYKASVMLVLLRHYNYEFSNFHQGYELRRGLFEKESPFVKAYLRIVGPSSIEYMTAGVAWSWVNAHPEFLKNILIAEEMKKIEDSAKEIEEMNNAIDNGKSNEANKSNRPVSK